MFSAEVREMLVQVITSWQVLVVTIVLVFYIFIVNNVSKLHRNGSSNPLLLPKPKFKKPGKPSKPETPAPSESDDLGLEEDVLEE